MSSSHQTLADLQNLATLYRQGHRSPVIERTVEKMVALERDRARQEAAKIEAKLQMYEQRHEMTSEDFYRRFRAGELGDDIDWVEWSVFYEMRAGVRQRLTLLEPRAPYEVG
jgi:hypothetical protein